MSQMKIAVILLLVLSFFACTEKNDNSQTYFPKPPKEKLDSVGTWLQQDTNYLKATYLPFFETHFNQQIAANNIDSAARLLDIAGRMANINYIFDSVLVQRHLDFLAKYETQIPYRFRSGLYNNLGRFYSNTDLLIMHDYKASIAFFKKNNALPTDYYSAYNNAIADMRIAFCFSTASEHDSCIIYALKALDFCEKYEDWIYQTNIYSSIEHSYSSIEDDVMAAKYADLMVASSRKSNDSDMIYSAMRSRILSFESMKSPLFSPSIDSLEQFVAQWKPTDPQYSFSTQSLKVRKLVKEGKIKEAKTILDKIAPLYPIVKDVYFNQGYPDALSDYEIATKKPLSMAQYYLEDLEMVDSTKHFINISINNDYLSKDAIIKKDYKAALEYYKKYINAEDSVRNNKIQYQARELEKKYQTEKKEAQLQLQAADAFKKNVFIGILVLGLLAFVYFYSLLKKQKNIISQQNELNEHTIAILSHDIKEPLLGVKLLLKKLNKDDPFVAQASKSLENQINSVNGILNNLLKMKKLSLGKKDKNIKADAKSVVQNVTQELSVAIQTKSLTIQNDLEDDVMIPIAPEKLQIIVHNLLSNAVKYSFPNQSIRIFKEGKGFCIQDFGVGLSPEQRSKIMREVTTSQQGTSQERGNGMGLFLVGAMLQGESIRLVFENSEVGGTIVKVLG